MRWIFQQTPDLLPAHETLPGGRHPVLENPKPHAVLGTPITGPWQEHQKSVLIGIGCFWGVEQIYWQMPGVESTSVGYAGGVTQNPTYREVCTGRTNHTEVVEVVYDPAQISLDEIVKVAFENHDPTQKNRQGNDVGTQYRSAIYVNTEAEKQRVQEIADSYEKALASEGFGAVTTEIATLAETPAGEYFLAEDEHQQYLHKVPNGYCPHHTTGVACTIPS